jgi:hypothetical protein
MADSSLNLDLPARRREAKKPSQICVRCGNEETEAIHSIWRPSAKQCVKPEGWHPQTGSVEHLCCRDWVGEGRPPCWRKQCQDAAAKLAAETKEVVADDA